MVETLQRDIGQLAISDNKTKGGSFLDIVGADVDSSFDKPMTVQVVQDTYHISVGGQTIGPDANIQIQIDDDNCLHYLHKYGIVADLYPVNCTVENAAMLFEGLEMQIGSVTWSCSFQRYYAQQKLSKLGKHKMEYIDNGIGLKHNGFAQEPHSNQRIYVPYIVNEAANPQVAELSRVFPYQLYVRQLQQHFAMRGEDNAAGAYRIKIYVPLPLIFPALWEFPDDGCIATTLGQKLKFNMKLCQSSSCLMSDGVGAPSYTMQNVSLVRFFTKLDPIRADLLLKSTVMLPQLKYQHWQQSVLQPVVNAIFGISAKDRIKGLIFGFHTNVGASNSADNSNLEANLINETVAQFKYPLGYFPQMPIQQIDIDVGGHTYSINMSQLQFIHLSNLFGDQKQTYDFPLQRSTKFAYYLDLTRFGFNEDFYGSSSKNITSVHVQITLKQGDANNLVKTLLGQPATWDSTTFANFGFFGYLELQQMFECRNGIFMSS